MSPDELWTWLQEEQSQSSGWQGERGETIGHERYIPSVLLLYCVLCARTDCMQWPPHRGHPGVQSVPEPGGILGPRRRAYAAGGGLLQAASSAGGEGQNEPGESQLSVVEELGA